MATTTKKKKRDVTISPSQLLAMDCRLCWDLGYRQGFRKRGITVALDLGTGFHAGMEEFYAEDPKTRHTGLLQTGFDRWADERSKDLREDEDKRKMDEIRKAGAFMLNLYGQYWVEQQHEELDVLTTEHTVKIPLIDPATGKVAKGFLNARLDGVVRDPRSGHLLVLEHKTYGRLDKADLERSHQFAIQILLARAMCQELGWGEKVIGVLYNGVKKPRWESGEYKFPAKGLTEKDWPDWFHRTTLLRTERQLQTVAERAFHQWKLFYGTKNLAIFPQPATLRCQMCDFTEVCLEQQRGGDWEWLLKEGYTKRGEKDAEPEEGE